MTAAIYRSTPSLSVPQTQNTAPVLEFACLYTHDLRKKTKKWHDGVLRYHTFNKRAMVYDVPRNFIGDMHWTGEEHMQEGDEVVLEKAGVRVEVAERIGETETDLSELRAKKPAGKNVEPSRRVERVGGSREATPIARAPSGSVARGNTQLKHKSLNALLGTPKGQMGKATLPTKSPFEERHANAENEEWEDGRPAKIARVTGTRTSKKTVKQDDIPLWARTADRNANGLPANKVFIDLSDDVTPSKEFVPGFSSDALAPSSPVRVAARDLSGSSSSPATLTRQPSLGPISVKDRPRIPRVQELDQGRVEQAGVPARHQSKARTSPQPAKQPSPQPSRPPSTKPGQTLRLAASAPKRRMLLCQDQLTKKPQRKPAADVEHAVDQSLEDSLKSDYRPKTAKERVQQRLDKINKRKARSKATAPDFTTTNSFVAVEIDDDVHLEMASGQIVDGSNAPSGASSDLGQAKRRAESANSQKAASNVVIHPQASPQRPDEPTVSHETSESGKRSLSEEFGQRSSHEVSAIELARLDRMMLPPAAPRRAPTPLVSILSPREARPLRRVISEPPNKPASRIVTNLARPGPKRAPGAPVRYTPTPSPTKRSQEPTPIPPLEKEARAPFKNKSKKNLQKSVSLNMTTAGTSTVILGRPFQAPGKPQTAKSKKPDPPPEDVGPWSREAFDLFKWRPPGWDEEKWCVVETVEGMDNTTAAPAGLSGGASLPPVSKERGRGS